MGGGAEAPNWETITDCASHVMLEKASDLGFLQDTCTRHTVPHTQAPLMVHVKGIHKLGNYHLLCSLVNA